MYHQILSLTSLAVLLISSTSAHPLHATPHDELRIVTRSDSANQTSHAPEFQQLLDGNKQFRADLKIKHPGLMKKLTTVGQQPPFMLISCSDSRVGEGTIFNARPGLFFSERNIANQFVKDDGNSQSVLAYAVTELRVKHVIVMGHYGCGGIAAATMNLPKPPLRSAAAAIHGWINPIRALYATSTRPEVVAMRKKNKSLTTIKEPELQDPGFRALIEENVKINVNRVATSKIITEHYALLLASQKPNGNSTVEKRSDHPTKPAAEVFIHGWVYDIENGEVVDLGVSVGPPGVEVPLAPFSAVTQAVKGSL